MRIVKDTLTSILETDNPKIIEALRTKYSFSVPGYQYSPAYRSRRWDGKKRYFASNGRFRTGLLTRVLKDLELIGVNTKDIVEERDGYYKVTGRTNEVINVGGLKFMASEVERIALEFEHVELVKAEGKPNPITGQHVELTVQVVANRHVDKAGLKKFLSKQLPNHMVPKRIRVASVSVGHRFKKS